MRAFFEDKFRLKLFIAMLCISLVPLIAISTYLSAHAASRGLSEMNSGSQTYLSEVDNNVSTLVENVDRLTQLVFSDRRLQAVLGDAESYTEGERSSVVDQFLLNLDTIIEPASDILIFSGEKIYSRYRTASSASKHFASFGQPWYYDTQQLHGGLSVQNAKSGFFDQYSGETVMLSRAILSLGSPNPEQIGTIIVEIKNEEMLRIAAAAGSYKGSFIAITDEYGRLIHSGREGELPPAGELDKAVQNNKTVNVGSTKYIVNSAKNNNTKWNIYHFIPQSYATSLSGEILRSGITALVICALLALLFAYLIAARVSKPLTRLRALTRRIGSGEIGATEQLNQNDEIGELAESINTMSLSLKQLIHTNYEICLQNKEAELRSLQNQINPHFLYNTLNSISLKAVCEGQKDIARMIGDLGSFFHISLSAGTDVVPLSEELRLCDLFVGLQKIRFGDRLIFSEQIDEKLLELMVPKLIIQPIVENAIAHGLADKIECGHVTLTVGRAKNGDLVEIIITDDGVGMSGKELAACLENLQSEGETRGIGLRNVNRRLRLYSDGRLGITIKSSEGNGTAVTLTLPAEGVKSVGEAFYG